MSKSAVVQAGTSASLSLAWAFVRRARWRRRSAQTGEPGAGRWKLTACDPDSLARVYALEFAEVLGVALDQVGQLGAKVEVSVTIANKPSSPPVYTRSIDSVRADSELTLLISAARSPGVTLRPHEVLNAFRAAATARSTSLGPPLATLSNTSAVAGFTVSNVVPS